MVGVPKKTNLGFGQQGQLQNLQQQPSSYIEGSYEEQATGNWLSPSLRLTCSHPGN